MYKTLIVVDNDVLCSGDAFSEVSLPHVITFDSYLKNYPKINEPKTRIINLCDTERYLSKGYYCSLLAEARKHNVLPSVKTINGLRSLGDDKEDLQLLIKSMDFSHIVSAGQECMVYFGSAEMPELQKLSAHIFNRYPAPIVKLVFFQSENGLGLKVERFSFSMLNASQRIAFNERLEDFVRNVWKIQVKQKRYRWDMAILVDPNEKVPPSDKDAIARFVKAATKYGIHAEVLSINELQHITQYDALFIRETTAIDHHTYRLACKAENSGLVVMDDSASILRCCNKVYLHDAFSYQKVPSLRTEVIGECNEETLDKVESVFSYPIILKMPEGSFSKGVYKVNNREELTQRWMELLQSSALILAQEYLYTEYDWRIGVLNGRAIYACRYLMARNHWQIYDHEAKGDISGGFETLPTFEVPKLVLDAALKACKIIGHGLYGVDIKYHNGHAYVLEVNDNPSIDHQVEDAYLGDELYMQIMGEFQRRLELRGR